MNPHIKKTIIKMKAKIDDTEVTLAPVKIKIGFIKNGKPPYCEIRSKKIVFPKYTCTVACKTF